MTNFKKVRLLVAVGVMLAPASAMAVEQHNNDIVKDARSNVVMNTFNNCVLTKWQSASEECGKAVARGAIDRLTKEQRTVYFDFNKSTLNASEKAKLDEIVSIVKVSKEVESVDIVGFADKIGNSGYNKTLSKRRADTVRSYLSAKGLKTRKVRVEAKGDSQPVTSCDDKADRSALIACLAEDRRVEIELNLKK